MNYLSHAGEKVPVDWHKVRRAYEEDHATLSGYTPGADGKPRYSRRPWPLEDVAGEIRYVVFHHSVTHDTKATEAVLRKRNLSVHIGVDPDGTVVQLLDLAVRDRSSGVACDRGIGVEVANVVEPYGNYTWKKPPPGYEHRQVVSGDIGGYPRRMFAYTPEQLAACAALAAALCARYPRMAPASPPAHDNSRRAQVLRGDRYGIIGHYHVTADAKKGKWDPGPAFDFPRLARAARAAVARQVIFEVEQAHHAGDPFAWDAPLLVQRALQALGEDLAADGAWGPLSEAAARRALRHTAGDLLAALRLSLQVPPAHPASGPGEHA